MTNPNGLDRFLARKLAGHTRLVSRRLFISKLARNVFAVAGVAVAAKVGLFEIGRLQAGSVSQNLSAPPANVVAGNGPGAVPAWKICGLHGYVCGTGNCSGGVSATGAGSEWIQCCQNPADSKWYCCHYKDQCEANPPAQKGCQSHNATPHDLRATLLWCRNADGTFTGAYLCTVVTCEANGAATEAGCTCTSGAVGGCGLIPGL